MTWLLEVVKVVGLLLFAFGVVFVWVMWWLGGDIPEGPKDGTGDYDGD
jgi:hypothetical protein